jgi:glycosyltransferase involved in cell wall biosynthesis
MAIALHIAAAASKTIWLLPESVSLPNADTVPKSIPARAATGISETKREGDLGGCSFITSGCFCLAPAKIRIFCYLCGNYVILLMKARVQLNELRCCVIIPVYNNAGTVAQVIAGAKRHAGTVIVVNDGSTDATAQILSAIPGITVLAFPKNKGKGYALRTGFRHALREGFRYAITIDGDGQHDPSDIPRFAEAMEKARGALVIGARKLRQENMPRKNTFANKFSNFWVWVETGRRLEDTQSGFRACPLEPFAGAKYFTRRYDFELEILVRYIWKGIPVVTIPVQALYMPKGERVSHFRPFRDFLRISLLNVFLVLPALLWFHPFSFIRRLRKENIKQWFARHILQSLEPNRKIALSVMLGVFMGIIPVWGYQMLAAFSLAHLLKLNKTIAVVASNISIPPMIPFILLGSFAAGAWVLNRPLTLSLHTVSFEAIGRDLLQYIVGSFLLASLCALAAGAVAGALLYFFRKPELT